MHVAVSNPVFVADDQLGYDRSRTAFAPGVPMKLDESYRLAHLPLVNPAHDDVIARSPGKSYDMGRHARIHSLVLPVSWDALKASPAFRALDDAIRRSSLAPKIAWNIMDQRADMLHATIAGSLGEGEIPPPISPAAQAALSRMGPLRVRISGLFSGNINLGRLYLKAYPALHDGENSFQTIQRLLGRNPTDLYVVGLYNLTDHLSLEETASLAALIEQWWEIDLLDLAVDELWLLSSCDDLVLDSRIERRISLLSL